MIADSSGGKYVNIRMHLDQSGPVLLQGLA